jgi:hypothetical protein
MMVRGVIHERNAQLLLIRVKGKGQKMKYMTTTLSFEVND